MRYKPSVAIIAHYFLESQTVLITVALGDLRQAHQDSDQNEQAYQEEKTGLVHRGTDENKAWLEQASLMIQFESSLHGSRQKESTNLNSPGPTSSLWLLTADARAMNALSRLFFALGV